LIFSTVQYYLSGSKVNYFGHAVVASWSSSPPDGGRALGAMLPDFQAMCGARAASFADAAIAAGVELHHATDAAFHALAPFTGLVRELEARLARAGVSRGPMRAAGHTGIELLLDGALLDDAAARTAYLAALEHPIDGITWRDPGDPARFAQLHARLRSHGVPDDLARPDSVAYRIQRMTAHRPLLRSTAAESDLIRRELAEIAPRVRVAAPTIVRALRARLDA
jgi:hypothetical protein